MTDRFQQITDDSEGRRTFIKCPHSTTVTSYTRLINLVDGPDAVVTLVLCGQCASRVAEKLLDERLSKVLDDWSQRTLPRNFFRKEANNK